MALSKAAKKDVLGKLETIINDSESLVFVHFKGLKVADTTQFRRKLKASDVGFFVSKKTLTRKALEAKEYQGTQPELEGEIGLAFGKDLVAPAREVFEFSKKFKDNLNIVGGIFEGKYMTRDEMISIASIPSQKTLYAMFANVINSPIQGIVMVLDQIAKKKTV